MRFLITFLFGASLVGAAPTPPKLRLPDTAAPVDYQVQLTLDPAKTDFSGRITINLALKQPTDVIWLNAVKLRVSKVRLSEEQGGEIGAHVVDGGTRFIGIEAEKPLAAGRATLTLEYSGGIRQRDSSGIFAMEDKGNRYLYTQFEPIDGRAAFPCFDEPSYKVPWQLSLDVPESQVAVSNTSPVSEERRGNRKVITFERTKPLPSYLVAFAVGPFEFVDGGKAGQAGVPVRIITPKGRAQEAQYAAEITATIITRLEKYFGIPFPYSKSDQLAIPVTYGFGAMENAGLVTYEQSILLADPDRDTEARRRSYATTAAHELAHQWFGDLVTTAWWNDIWLNEAFATWMEQKLIREWKPEWDTKPTDVESKLFAEGQDSLLSARKVRQEIESENDIGNAFDAITYQKGAAVIGMFESYVGPENFRKGVTTYLRHYSYKNANAPEFLDQISSASGKNINGAFSSFLNQSGVPVVDVALDCSGGKSSLQVKQSRYVLPGEKAAGDQTWQIPVCIRTDGGSFCEVTSGRQAEIPLAHGCPGWVEANANASGYYRVHYSRQLLNGLISGDVQKRLTPSERVDLMGNVEALATAGTEPVAEALNLVKPFHADPETEVVRRALDLALFPNRQLVPDNLRSNYQRFLQANFDEKARLIGWQPKSDDTPAIEILRPVLVRTIATTGGDQMLAEQAEEMTQLWLQGKTAVAPAVLGGVLETAAYYGDAHLAQEFIDRLKTTTDRQDRRRIFAATRAFRNKAALEVFLNALVSGAIPSLEGNAVLYAGQGSSATREVGFNFLQEHYDQLMKIRPGGGGFDAASSLPRVGENFCDPQSRERLQAFFEPKISGLMGAQRVYSQVIEGVNSCIAQKQEQEPEVAAFLRQW